MKFKEATEKVLTLKRKPDDKTLLKLYGLYKQATVGNCNTPEPTYFIVKSKEWYKWNAWKLLNGNSKEVAEKAYVKVVERLFAEESRAN